MIKYIGSKRTLVPRIEQIVRGLPVASACDLFAGTTRVAQTLRKLGLHVVANDLASYSEAFGQAYVERSEQGRIPALLTGLREAEPRNTRAVSRKRLPIAPSSSIAALGRTLKNCCKSPRSITSA